MKAVETDRFRRRGRQWVSLLYKASRNLVAGVLGLMVLLVVVDVTGRNLFDLSFPGTVELNEYFLIIIGFIGIFQTHHENGHVSVDLLYIRLPGRVKRALDFTNNAMILSFCLVFLYAGTERFWAAFQCGETNWFGAYVLPVWGIRLVVPIGCFALCIQSLINIIDPEIQAEG